jgi:hypothetical protein
MTPEELTLIMTKICAYRGMEYRVCIGKEIDAIQKSLGISDREFPDVLHAFGVIYQDIRVEEWAIWHEAGHALTATPEQSSGVHWLGEDKSQETVNSSEEKAVLASLVLAEAFSAEENVLKDIIEITWENISWKGTVSASIPKEDRGNYETYRTMANSIQD